MKSVNLYAYGRVTAGDGWLIDPGRVVNRVYYVNGGNAVIRNSVGEYALRAGNVYIISRSRYFEPVFANGFDHTYFDFYSSRLLNYDNVIEIDASFLGLNGFFSHINAVIERDTAQKSRSAVEDLLIGFLSLIDTQHAPLPYVTNATVNRAVELIHRESATLTTRELSHRLNLNESHLIRLFSNAIGLSPMKYIRMCRVLYGRELLLGGCSVAEAAEKCGYGSAAAFYKAVRSEWQRTPSSLK